MEGGGGEEEGEEEGKEGRRRGRRLAYSESKQKADLNNKLSRNPEMKLNAYNVGTCMAYFLVHRLDEDEVIVHTKPAKKEKPCVHV